MDVRALFHDLRFDIAGEVWTSSIENTPGASASGTDVRIVSLLLRRDDLIGARHLELFLSDALLHDQSKNYSQQIEWRIQEWLSTPEQSGRLVLLQWPN